jgi:hypothetical protein
MVLFFHPFIDIYLDFGDDYGIAFTTSYEHYQLTLRLIQAHPSAGAAHPSPQLAPPVGSISPPRDSRDLVDTADRRPDSTGGKFQFRGVNGWENPWEKPSKDNGKNHVP